MKTKPINRRWLLSAGTAALLWPTGARPQSDQRPPEGGIGGTGIVGTLTDFGSLIVAGNKVETDPDTRISNAFGAIREGQLKIGDTLTIEASRTSSGLRAERVQVDYPLVGRIERVSFGGRVLEVNGTPVVLESSARPQPVGRRVAVSGLWRGPDVIASAITPVPDGPDLISGTVDRSLLQSSIGNVVLRGRGRGVLSSGGFATVLGRYDSTSRTFQATETRAERFVGAAGPLQSLAIEGYLEPDAGAPGFRISGLGHSFTRNLSLERFGTRRVLFTGGYTGRFSAERGLILPEDPRERRTLLRRISAQG